MQGKLVQLKNVEKSPPQKAKKLDSSMDTDTERKMIRKEIGAKVLAEKYGGKVTKLLELPKKRVRTKKATENEKQVKYN